MVDADCREARGEPGPLCSARGVRNRLKLAGLRPLRRRGQNFLCHPGILRDTLDAAALNPEDTVLEIGAGLGTLTSALAPLVRRVVAVEVDRGLFSLLSESVGGLPRVTLVLGDILELSPRELLASREPFKVVANLPYYLSTPLLQRMFTAWAEMTLAVVMLQEEVALRLTASPGDAGYGALSVFAAYHARTEVVRLVPPSAFWPRPEVGSALVTIARRPPPVEAEPGVLFDLVRSAFGQRRKQMRNALTGPPLGLTRKEADELLSAGGIPAARRAETISLAEFAVLARLLSPRRP